MSDAEQGNTPDTQQPAQGTTAQEKPAAPQQHKASDFKLDDLEQDLKEAVEKSAGGDAGLEAVYDIPVRVSAVLGETHLQIHELLKLGRGAIVPLDRRVGESIDIYVNDRLVARGEVVIIEDKLGVTMTEVVKVQK